MRKYTNQNMIINKWYEMQPNVDILVLSYFSKDDLQEFLPSISSFIRYKKLQVTTKADGNKLYIKRKESDGDRKIMIKIQERPDYL